MSSVKPKADPAIDEAKNEVKNDVKEEVKEEGKEDGKEHNQAKYRILSEKHKIFMIITASMVNFLGPVSANIYYPALGPMATELGVSKSETNLTITSYMVIIFFLYIRNSKLTDR